MPQLENLLMHRYKLRYCDVHSVVLEERVKLGLPRNSSMTPELFDICARRYGDTAPSQTSFYSLEHPQEESDPCSQTESYASLEADGEEISEEEAL
mmetsp:Transcript_18797/g.24213  ORF Transcript_18797/g.24213 Transcript_18797/m.24213 type:complete len:96 (-) Transcript_18797:198-485(-)|eukprot:CAMPEP_0198145890 /NCGR_PEP_ID=MMETSP1443-20131203/25993_1 /TAXON_ID=186043 /ORGANISM="Entomoneis sp., Strain CCMP2396" /LENGTH=95 /DNA_ID=CAMNT_0043809651 /DNA_START=80 /DNA_END=367 /DNA_ORIENTATION=-